MSDRQNKRALGRGGRQPVDRPLQPMRTGDSNDAASQNERLVRMAALRAAEAASIAASFGRFSACSAFSLGLAAIAVFRPLGALS